MSVKITGKGKGDKVCEGGGAVGLVCPEMVNRAKQGPSEHFSSTSNKL